MVYLTNLENYYGTVVFYEKDDKYYWSLQDHSETYTEEIPDYLFLALKRFLEEGCNYVLGA